MFLWKNGSILHQAEFGLDNLWRRAGNAGNGRPQEVSTVMMTMEGII